ncbi:MAG: Rpp14/Pop5 family protein [Candidatus Bilamarchaeaceae archaeon]
MVRAYSKKRRHILFEVAPPQSEQETKSVLYREGLKFFGEYGMSFAQFRLSAYDEKTGRGILTVSRDYAHLIPGFLALIEHPRIIALKTSGIMRKLGATDQKQPQ